MLRFFQGKPFCNSITKPRLTKNKGAYIFNLPVCVKHQTIGMIKNIHQSVFLLLFSDNGLNARADFLSMRSKHVGPQVQWLNLTTM